MGFTKKPIITYDNDIEDKYENHKTSYGFRLANGRSAFPDSGYTIFNQIPESGANYRLIINYI